MNPRFHRLVLTAAIVQLTAEAILALLAGNQTPVPEWGWIFLSILLITYVLSVYASHIDAETMQRRWLFLFIVSGTVGSVSIMIEAAIFNVTTIAQTIQLLSQGILKFALLSAVLAYLFQDQRNMGKREEPSRSFISWSWRIAVTTCLYIVFYFAAGMILQATLPALNEFYQGNIPPISTILTTQVIRGLILSLIGVLFIHTCSLTGRSQGVLYGLILSIVGGIAPLILPNDLMPADLRTGHAFEVGISNFLFGFLTLTVLRGRNKVIVSGQPVNGQPS